MEDAKKSYRDILRFVETATNWQRKAPKKGDPMTGFKYSVSRVLRATEGAVEDYKEEAMRINIESASQDEKTGAIQTDDRGETIFTKDGARERNEKMRKLNDEQVEIKVYFSKVYPDDLTESQIQAFEGFVIKEREEPAEEPVV
jgi:hypothetical protein